MSTLFALASAPGRAGVSVVRLSGPEAPSVFAAMCRPASVPKPRYATLKDLIDPVSRDVIDHALVLWFPAPKSFTGEDVVELHIHGGRAVLASLLKALARLPGFEPAGPGAFSRRAFENGKMDLTEAEAIADLVDAETEAQKKQALRQMDGALGALYRGWAERLKEALAFMEAGIDFADEDVPEEIARDQAQKLGALKSEIEHHLNDNRRGERLREGFSVALLGAPNAGKSSLLNALAGREAAIVSSIPGTTRDIIEVSLDLGGWPVTLADTAGLRESAEQIESEGVRRALKRAEDADITLIVFDGAEEPLRNPQTQSLIDARSLCLLNKKDCLAGPAPSDLLCVSAKTGEGLDALVQALIEKIETRFGMIDLPSLTRTRHRAALEESVRHLDRALAALEDDLRAEDTRLALRALGKITGRVDVEDLLDVIFSSFCIGK